MKGRWTPAIISDVAKNRRPRKTPLRILPKSLPRKVPEYRFDLSICVAIKNRSRVQLNGRILELFPTCVESIVQSIADSDSVELVVSDYSSDDWPLDEWLPEAVGSIPLTIVPASGSFSRGGGLNLAAAHATGRVLLFLDADMIVSPVFITRALEVGLSGAAFFPICWSFKDADHSEGWWRHTGFGNCALSYDLFLRSGGWDEIKEWGREDKLLYKRALKAGGVTREPIAEFFHQWHSDKRRWKNRYVGTG